MLPFKFRNPDTAQATVGTLAIGPFVVIPTLYFMQFLSFEGSVISLIWFSFVTLYVLGVLATSLTTISTISVLNKIDKLSEILIDKEGFIEIDESSDPEAIEILRKELKKMADESKSSKEEENGQR